MSTTITIPMNEETRIALEDCFIDIPNMDARKFLFDNIKLACQDAKRSVRNQITPINKMQESGMRQQEEFSLKGVDLNKYSLDSNPKWVPKNLSVEENKPIELKLGDNTMKYLKLFGSIILVRHEQFNAAEDAYVEITRGKMQEAGAPEENMKAWEKSQEDARAKRMDEVPNCLEHAIYTPIWPIIQAKIDQADAIMFDKEYQEEYQKADSVVEQPKN